MECHNSDGEGTYCIFMRIVEPLVRGFHGHFIEKRAREPKRANLLSIRGNERNDEEGRKEVKSAAS
jgi:hypothetical protein